MTPNKLQELVLLDFLVLSGPQNNKSRWVVKHMKLSLKWCIVSIIIIGHSLDHVILIEELVLVLVYTVFLIADIN